MKENETCVPRKFRNEETIAEIPGVSPAWRVLFGRQLVDALHQPRRAGSFVHIALSQLSALSQTTTVEGVINQTNGGEFPLML